MHAYYAADLDRLFREYKRSLYISPKKRLLITQSTFANGALHEPDPGLVTRVGIGREREENVLRDFRMKWLIFGGQNKGQ